MSTFYKKEFDDNPFMNANGAWYTTSLFYEMGYSELAVYTTRDTDQEINGKVYPSLKRLYLEEEDVTEYEFAIKHLGGWKHWKALLNSPKIAAMIEDWREELELKIRARGLKAVIRQAGESFQASKFLADRGWVDNRTKAARQSNRKQKQRMKEEFSEDIERLAKLELV